MSLRAVSKNLAQIQICIYFNLSNFVSDAFLSSQPLHVYT